MVPLGHLVVVALPRRSWVAVVVHLAVPGLGWDWRWLQQLRVASPWAQPAQRGRRHRQAGAEARWLAWVAAPAAVRWLTTCVRAQAERRDQAC